MTHTRGTTNTNARGSAVDRRARKIFLLIRFGDGYTAPCSFEGCGLELDFFTITVDRIVRGTDGGTYRRDNICPACAFHNASDGSLEMWRRRREAC